MAEVRLPAAPNSGQNTLVPMAVLHACAEPFTHLQRKSRSFRKGEACPASLCVALQWRFQTSGGCLWQVTTSHFAECPNDW